MADQYGLFIDGKWINTNMRLKTFILISDKHIDQLRINLI